MENTPATRRGRDLAAKADEAIDAIRTKRVVIHRPADNKDKGIHLGFNTHRLYAEFGAPVDAPAELVDYFRRQMQAVVSADDKGQPVVTHMPFLMIQDAPAELPAYA